MHARVSFVLSCALCLALTAGAQVISDVHFFPGAARLAGEPPSQWVSDVSVANLMETPVEIGFLFLPEKTEHGMFDIVFEEEYRYQLEPRETRLFQDVLGTVYGFTRDIKGGLLVTCDPEMLGGSPSEEDINILATMRTYDVSSPVGTYGQTIAATEYHDNSYRTPSFITGARNDDRFRSNLGIVNYSLEEVTVHYRVLDSSANVLAEGSKTLRSLSLNQWSFNRLGVGTVEGPLTVDLWLDEDDIRDPCMDAFEGGTAFMAYVSKVDADTQDAEFMYAAPSEVRTLNCDW
jgi:hypothetical protein